MKLPWETTKKNVAKCLAIKKNVVPLQSNSQTTCARFNDSVAQLVEQLTLNQWVVGSSPTGVTKANGKNAVGFFLSFVEQKTVFRSGNDTLLDDNAHKKRLDTLVEHRKAELLATSTLLPT